ncbi:hypothetical protein YC2023_002719 [Brassica napus]
MLKVFFLAETFPSPFPAVERSFRSLSQLHRILPQYDQHRTSKLLGHYIKIFKISFPFTDEILDIASIFSSQYPEQTSGGEVSQLSTYDLERHPTHLQRFSSLCNGSVRTCFFSSSHGGNFIFSRHKWYNPGFLSHFMHASLIWASMEYIHLNISKALLVKELN